MADKPWWRRLDGQPPNPEWWDQWSRSRLAIVGFGLTIVFASNFVLRLVFSDRLGFAWVYGILTAASVVALVVGVRRSRT